MAKIVKKTKKIRTKKIRQKNKKNKIKNNRLSLEKQEIKKFFHPSNSNIVFYNKLSYFFWSLSILAALLTLIFIGFYELFSHIYIIKPLSSPSYLYSQFIAEVIAILILFVELAGRFINASNKALFIKQNWLAIIAILPIGLFARGLRTFELLGILEELYIFRGFQIIGKLSELDKIILSSRFFSAILEIVGRGWYIISEFIIMLVRLFRIFK
ncbi:MAG: hypothetical protein QXV44_00705 [Candidatus Anstonellaceae archaeon]